jgi:NADH:ubiquinone oxidoreductase subunit 4 (subunit M)
VLLVCLLVFGCLPRLLTDKINPAAQNVLTPTAPVKQVVQTEISGARN